MKLKYLVEKALDIAQKQLTSRQLAKFFVLVILSLVFVSLLGGKSAMAQSLPLLTLSPNPGSGGEPAIPSGVYNYLINCNGQPQSPAFLQWISPAGQPSQLTATVAYGAPSVQLEYDFVGAVCHPNSAVTTTNVWIADTIPVLPEVVGIKGQVLSLNWGSKYNLPGAYARDFKTFTFAPNNGFTSSRQYTITLDTRPVNIFTSGVMMCVANGAVIPPSYGYAGFYFCPINWTKLDIYINVLPPAGPTVDLKLNGSHNPGSITQGSPISLSWTSTNAVSCSASAGNTGTWSGPKPLNNSNEPHNSDSSTIGIKTYTITCTNPAGVTVTDTVSVVVTLPPPPAALACSGVSFSPASPNPGDTIIVSASFANTGGVAISGASLVITVNGVAYPAIPINIAPGMTSSGSISVNLPPVPVSWSVTSAVIGGPASPYCGTTIDTSAQPYLKVFGGDVRAGTGIGAPCGPTLVGINTWANSSNHTGSSAEFGVMASGGITGFYSAGLRTGPPLPDAGLTFANTGGGWGGNFGNSSNCMPNFWTSLKQPSPTASAGGVVNVSPAGQYQYTSGNSCGSMGNWSGSTCFTTNGNGVMNSNQTVFVNGDLNIKGDIKYSAGWASVGTMPYLTTVVCGNIYIDSSVGEVDGWYIALTRNLCSGGGALSGGSIYTCTSGFQFVASSALYGTCNRQLLIRGSFTANKVKFQRTNGSLNMATRYEDKNSSTSAEKFIYGPEMWIVQPVQPSPNPTKFDSYTGLPPIL